MKKVAVLDFETTSLDPGEGKIIEGAVTLLDVEGDGRLGAEQESYVSLNDPGISIPPWITRITGITDAMVGGELLDIPRFLEVCGKAEFLIAHNARFDRSWLEAHMGSPAFKWACSRDMIEWRRIHDMPCRTLKHLAWEHDYFPTAHRAADDVATLIHLLRLSGRGNTDRTYFQELASNAGKKQFVVFAWGSPYETREVLRRNSFRWSVEKRVWWKAVSEEDRELTEKFLKDSVYVGEPQYRVEDFDPLSPDSPVSNGRDA